jgi:threonyl-tRNA synthetase
LRILGIHTKYFRFDGKEKATQAAESTPSRLHKADIDRECLVIFISVEKEDEESPVSVAVQLVEDTLKKVEQLGVKTVVVYPYVHLTENPSRPRVALKVLDEVESRLVKSVEVIRAPFGWYKAFEISCLGHPLSEWSGRYFPGKEAVSPVKEKEKVERKPSEFTRFVITDLEGNLFEITSDNFKDSKVFSNKQPVYQLLKQFVSNELTKGVETEGPPKHIEYMQQHELVDYCDASEKGQMVSKGIADSKAHIRLCIAVSSGVGGI